MTSFKTVSHTQRGVETRALMLESAGGPDDVRVLDLLHEVVTSGGTVSIERYGRPAVTVVLQPPAAAATPGQPFVNGDYEDM